VSRASLGLPRGAVVGDGAPQLDSPATTALALVTLAAWGVFLVTRRGVRRGLAVLAVVAALGAAATCFSRPDTSTYGVSSYVPVSGTVHITTTLWPWVALAAALVAALAAASAVVWAPQWPEMGSKYDAPTASKPSAPAEIDLAGAENLELWRSISEGRDPTSDRD
jgi:uncharacterized membrane protein (TIGR02234 family)